MGEPGNPSKSQIKQRQLRLLTVKSVKSIDVESLPWARKKRSSSELQYVQLSLFSERDVGTTS